VAARLLIMVVLTVRTVSEPAVSGKELHVIKEVKIFTVFTMTTTIIRIGMTTKLFVS
jgi:hypothetical protein